ncbi:hypothetical protein PVAP13_4NG063021 [Panicum virgatum]|uniref:Uncharacterized protein n=1 Tax=Panicum virgatum TaxID=38727 RepID=A0A8T0T6I0_PANVG|nr:hypothetical protein PVAP13_4NG063021 [Panicum virgatum]
MDLSLGPIAACTFPLPPDQGWRMRVVLSLPARRGCDCSHAPPPTSGIPAPVPWSSIEANRFVRHCGDHRRFTPFGMPSRQLHALVVCWAPHIGKTLELGFSTYF